MQIRFFLRIFLGVMALNLYAKGQVENVTQSMPPPSTPSVEGETSTQHAEDDQKYTTTRDPFWPVGYVPVAEEVAVTSAVAADVDETGGHVDFSGLTTEEQAIIKSKMVVGGILKRGSNCLAIINQQLVKEGEELSLSAEQQTYRFRVKQLTPDRILLESLQDE